MKILESVVIFEEEYSLNLEEDYSKEVLANFERRINSNGNFGKTEWNDVLNLLIEEKYIFILNNPGHLASFKEHYLGVLKGYRSARDSIKSKLEARDDITFDDKALLRGHAFGLAEIHNYMVDFLKNA